MKLQQPKVKLKNAIMLNELNEIDDDCQDDNIEKYINYEHQKANMIDKIQKHNKDIWVPPINTKFNDNSKIKSWFSIYESNPKNVHFIDGKYNFAQRENVKYKSKEITLNLTKKQKYIINTWLNAYLEMYNIALKYIKDNIQTNKQVLDYKHTRSQLLKEKRKIINKYNKIVIRKTKKISIKVHDIDYAIKLACSNWKSAISNLKAGHIKQFRVRYWRKNKPIKIMDLEKQDFQSGSIRKNILGQIKGTYNGKTFNLSKIDCDCKLKRDNNKYYLYVPEYIDAKDKMTKEKKEKKGKEITIDLGIRRFGTCITENKIVKIGENCDQRIKEYLLRKDNIINNEEICKEIKKKNELMINRKIRNLVREMHWKTIDYLINNYEKIIIGDLSAKKIVSKDGNLCSMTKRIAMSLSYYKFRQRLKYKCDVKGISYGMINEWMTSKMCSKCGEINWKLGSKKTFKCEGCELNIDRDINGARNINIKARK